MRVTRRRPEHAFQIEVMNFLDQHGRRELDWRAIPNGGFRHPNVALQLKAEGVKPGTPDIFIMLDEGKTGWLELKSKRGSLSDAQKGFAAKANRLGHRWACVRTLKEAETVLDQWRVLR